MNRMFAWSSFNNDSLKNWLHTSKHSFGISFLDSKNSYNKQLLYFTKLASICKQIVFNSYFYLVSNVKDMNMTFFDSLFNGNTNEFKKKTSFLFKFFNEIFISLKQCGLNYDFVHKINSSDRQNYQTIMFDNKVLIRINKSKLSYFYSSWNIYNVKSFDRMFQDSIFDRDISSWNFNENVDCYKFIYDNQKFYDKYNNGKEISIGTKKFLEWFKNNRENIKEINNPKEEVLDFFSFDSNLNKDIK